MKIEIMEDKEESYINNNRIDSFYETFKESLKWINNDQFESRFKKSLTNICVSVFQHGELSALSNYEKRHKKLSDRIKELEDKYEPKTASQDRRYAQGRYQGD